MLDDLTNYFHEFQLGYPDINLCGICGREYKYHRTKEGEIIRLHAELRQLRNRFELLLQAAKYAIENCPRCGGTTVSHCDLIDVIIGEDRFGEPIHQSQLVPVQCADCAPLIDAVNQVDIGNQKDQTDESDEEKEDVVEETVQ